MNMDKEVLQVNIDDIIPNRFQPRLSFDEQGLQELAASIKEHGIIQPLVLRKLGNKYEIIAGERRYKASQMAGLTTVPAVISNIDDNKSAEVALVENLQRRDLTPIEEARSYKSLLDRGYLTQDALAKKMGLSQSSISNKLRLLNLDETVQQALLEERISERHARALLALPNKEDQKKFLEKTISERLTVRALDAEIKKYLEGTDADIPKVNLTPNIENIRNNAIDLNKTRMSADSMMVPDSVLTDYSSTLPSSSNVTDLSSFLNSTPTENKNPDLGIPNFTDTAAPKSQNRFFNNLEPEKKEDNFNIDSLFQLNTNPNNAPSNLEIIDDPMNKKEEVKPATLNTTPEFNNSNYLGPQTNRFFNTDPAETITVKEPERNPIFDPMSLVEEEKVDTLGPLPTNEKNIIDNTMNTLKQQGLNAELNVSDTLNSTIYTIIVRK